MEIYILDMGQTKYGDCILVTHKNRTILIDGGHVGDSDLITDQLKTILDGEPPFNIDLLIITHCHSDHIGCLPKLINTDIIVPAKALFADEKLGWGRSSDGSNPIDALPDKKRKLFYALQEEDHSDLDDQDLAEFIQDAAKLEDQYKAMIEQLENNGVQVLRYGKNSTKSLETEFSEFGLKILGPTDDHLVVCAEALSNLTDFVGMDNVDDIGEDASDQKLVNKYRQLNRRILSDSRIAADSPGPGAAKNNQSIVLKFNTDGWSALLGGDMQFAKSEVPDLDPFMTRLRTKIVNAGPYDFVKLSHHTSYNGFNEDVLDDYSSTGLFAHSGGRKDASHPEESALEVLKDNKDRLLFARTDRNGMITVKKVGNKVKMLISKGQFNNFALNKTGDEETTEALEVQSKKVEILQEKDYDGMVEVITRIPKGVNKLTVTIEVDAGNGSTETGVKKKFSGQLSDSKINIGSGRKLPDLLFVTSIPLLKRNIGEVESDIVVDAIRKHRNIELLDLSPDINSASLAAELVRKKLANASFNGVVILGGYDIIPSRVWDTIDQDLRQKLVQLDMDKEDADDFIVWSDDIYGDMDGDYLPEIPVSRLPDARRADVLFAALQTPDFIDSPCFGIRNIARPFADITYSGIPGSSNPIEISETFGPSNIKSDLARGAVYYMLHGSYRDGTCFWGETNDGDEFEAISLANVPKSAPGTIVFTGCCWGALPVFQPAVRTKPNSQLVPKLPEESIAISYLLSGAQAFIGCTGSHYSPLREPYNYYGKPMHDLFWSNIAQNQKPAEALFNAKKEYAVSIPHGKQDSFSRAIELKILRQYTCLGLGW